MDTREPGHVDQTPDPDRGVPSLARWQVLVTQWHPKAAMWGVLLAARTIAFTLLLSALVLAPVVLVDTESPFALRTFLESTTWGWLLLNGAPPRLGAAVFTLVPWGLALIPWLLNYHAARFLARRYQGNRRFILMSTTLLFLTYVVAVTLAAVFIESISLAYSAWAALIVAALLNGSAIMAGVLSTHVFPVKLPEILRFILARGVAAVFALFGVAAIVLAVLLVANFADVLFLFNQLNPGYSGFVALTVLSLGYLPVLTVWAMAYLVGAGFSIGPEVVVSPFIPVTAPTQLPPFPPLAVLPEQAGGIAWMVPSLVIALGVLWGIGISVRMARESALMRLVIAVGIAVVAAVITMALVALSVGDLGDVRLVDLGPDPTLVGSLTWLLLVVGMTPAALLPARVFTRRRAPQITVVSE